MPKRILTTIVGLPLVIFIVNHGGWLLLMMCLALSLIGLRELYRAFHKADKPVHFVGYGFTIVYFIVALFFGVSHWIIVTIALFVVVSQAFLVAFFNDIALEDVTVTIYGFMYVPLLLSFIFLVRESHLGQFYVWLIFTSAFGCDSFAYITGISVGRHKLVNTPSPKKSVEGLIGGVLGAALIGFLYGFFVTRFAATEVPYIMIIATVVSLFGAMFSIMGDMAASAIKRRTGIKDFGALLPGHGGVVDRVDSVLFVAPFVFLAVNLLFGIMPGVCAV